MKKRYIILGSVLLLIALFVLGLGIYFYPDIKCAETLGKNMDFTHFSYDMTVSLDLEELKEEQRQLLDKLDMLIGSKTSEAPAFRITGEVSGEIVHAVIYLSGTPEPVTEVYFSDTTDVINGAVFYDAVRKNIIKKNSLLAYVMPEWEEHAYVTFEQMEQMFGIDLEAMKGFSLSVPAYRPGLVESWKMLTDMERIKGEDGSIAYLLEQDGLSVNIGFQDASLAEPVIECRIQESAQLSEEEKDILSGLGIDMEQTILQAVEEVTVRMIPGDVGEIQIPDDYVSQDIVESIAKIRSLLLSR